MKSCCCLVAKLCLTLCNPMDHGVSQTRILEWVAMFSSRGSSPPRDGTRISHISTLAGRFFPTEPPGKLSDIKYIHSVVQPSPSSLGLVHLPQLKFCPTKPELPVTCLFLAPSNHTMTFYLYEFAYSRYFTEVESYNSCLFVTGLFHLA